MEPTVPDDRRQRRNCGMHGLRFPRCPLIIIDSSSHTDSAINVNPSGQFNKDCVFCKKHVLINMYRSRFCSSPILYLS
jgi:hypothetical protein